MVRTMNKKGFTLIELLGSIVILAALALVAFPAILSVLNSGQEQVDESVIKFIESAAADYVNDNLNTINNDTGTVTGCTLVENGYISTTFYDKYKEEIDNHQITYSLSRKEYSYDSGGSQSNCLE